MAKQVICRTVYEQTPVEDGTRVLVDRVWPQDISEEAARLDEWLSTVAPSAALQRTYSQEPLEYSEFRHRYLAELEDPEHRQAANHLRDLAEHTRLTLLTSAEDPHGGHVAVLAEWLARADPAQSEPPSRGFRARVSSAVADLNAGAFAFVMGTGIVSTGLNINGAHTASAVLLVVGLIGCAVLLPAYAWRLLRRMERDVADFVGPRGFSFLTIVIAADVMAARLAPDGHTAAAYAFLAFGAVGWLLLGYAIPLGLIASVRRNPSVDHVNGAWFLWAVGSESVALAAAALAQQVSGRRASGSCPGLLGHRTGAVPVDRRSMVLGRLLTRPVEPRSLMTSSWIFMGAAAITVLAGTRLLSLPSGNMLLSRPLIMRLVGGPVVVLHLADPAAARSRRLAARRAQGSVPLRIRLVEPGVPHRHVRGHQPRTGTHDRNVVDDHAGPMGDLGRRTGLAGGDHRHGGGRGPGPPHGRARRRCRRLLRLRAAAVT